MNLVVFKLQKWEWKKKNVLIMLKKKLYVAFALQSKGMGYFKAVCWDSVPKLLFSFVTFDLVWL